MTKIAPMLAKLAHFPADESSYGFEIKWDGIRALVDTTHSRVQILSRSGKDITHQYPEISGLSDALTVPDCIMDGEIITYDAEGRPSFSRLQHRMGVTDRKKIAFLTQMAPVTYVIFDILACNANQLLALPYTERRGMLESLGLSGSHWQTPPWSRDGVALLDLSRKLRLEGIMAKKLDSLYWPGRRTDAWLKIKNQLRQELVIGGWLVGEGSRQGTVGSLLVGYYNGNSQLRYAGAVGTGFTTAALKQLHLLLTGLAQSENPFTEKPPHTEPRYVRPVLICEIAFTEWTPNNTLRHPVFKGLRYDKNPRSIVREYYGKGG